MRKLKVPNFLVQISTDDLMFGMYEKSFSTAQEALDEVKAANKKYKRVSAVIYSAVELYRQERKVNLPKKRKDWKRV